MRPIHLFPSLEGQLLCPSRYWRGNVLRELVQAPLARFFAGRWVHQCIAMALQGHPLDPYRPIPWPRQVMLNDGEDLGSLESHAHSALERFAREYLGWLRARGAVAEERLETGLEVLGRPVVLSGRVDARVGSRVWDWKTGSLEGCADQLQEYLFLLYQRGQNPAQACAVNLHSGEQHVEAWDEHLIEVILDRLKSRLEGLLRITPEHHPPRPGRHCRFCLYAPACPESQSPRRFVVNTRTGEADDLTCRGAIG